MRILLVDNDCSYARSLTNKLQQITDDILINQVDNTDGAISKLNKKKFDFILAAAPSVNDIQSLQIKHPETPLFIFSDNNSTDTVVNSIKAGAVDCLNKPLSPEEIFDKFNNYTQEEFPWRWGYTLNDYCLKSLIFETPTSLVFKAYKDNAPKTYVVKAIKQEELELNELALKRFEREVEVMNKMDHPNIIHIYHFGVTTENLPYMIMPYIEGSTLGEVMHSMTEVQFLDVMLSLLDTLWDVHKHNIIHRDLKPENIMFCEGRPILLDFGTVLVRNDMSITHEDAVLGTPNYMAPETFSSTKKVDYRSDIYALGIILYEYVYKKCPYDGANFREIYTNLHTLTDEDLYHGSKYDELLKGLIKRNPNDRHDSVLTISEELMKIKMTLAADT